MDFVVFALKVTIFANRKSQIMKKAVWILLILFFVSVGAQARTDKRNVMFNVMAQSGAPSKKEMGKILTQESGVMSVKSNRKQGTMLVTYNANATNIQTIRETFRKNRFLAFPVGENCSNKRGGCLNNIPSF